jgi:hypothetical protein
MHHAALHTVSSSSSSSSSSATIGVLILLCSNSGSVAQPLRQKKATRLNESMIRQVGEILIKI